MGQQFGWYMILRYLEPQGLSTSFFPSSELPARNKSVPYSDSAWHPELSAAATFLLLWIGAVRFLRMHNILASERLGALIYTDVLLGVEEQHVCKHPKVNINTPRPASSLRRRTASL